MAKPATRKVADARRAGRDPYRERLNPQAKSPPFD